MKKKYLKKMLAIMLASMTVAATPGLVGAMNEKSKDAIRDANSKIANHELTIEEATHMLNDLEKMANEDDEAKKEVANTLGDMIHEGLFGKTSHHNDHMLHFDAHMCSPENLSKIIKIFKTCSTSDIAKRSTAWAIGAMAREGLLGKAPSKISSLLIPQCSPKNFSDVIDILEQCLEYKDNSVKKADYFKAKQHVSNSILQMAGQGVLGESNAFLHMFGEEPFRECPPEQISRIMGLLEKCLKDNEETVADDIASLASHKLLGQYPNDKILAMLQECLKNPNAKEAVAQALRICAGRNLLDQNSLRPVLYMLEQCLQSHGAKRSVAPAISFMAEYGVFGRDSLNQILNMLNSCSDDSYDDYFIPQAIINMVETGLINEQTIDNEILVQILQKRSQDRYSREHVSKAIKVIAQKNLLNQCSTDKLKRIIASLLLCREYTDFSKENVSETVQAMADQGILYRCEPNQIREIVGALADCLRAESFRREAINAVMAMNDKNLLNQCDPANINQMVDALIGCLGSTSTMNEASDVILAINEKGLLNRYEPANIHQTISSSINNLANNNTREASITIIAAIIRNNNVLNQLTPAELDRIKNSLPGDLANNKTREAATVIISAMAENPATFGQFNIAQLRQILSSFKTHLENYLADGNYEMVDRIFEVCKKCSEIDDLKAYVMETLDQDSTLQQYLNQNALNPRLGNMLEICISCSQTQNVETRKKAVFAVANVISRAGKTDEATQLTEETIIQIAPKIPQIIKMLEESSTVNEAKLDVSDIINLLGGRGFFQNLSHDENSRLITALSNCLTYGDELISTTMKVNDEQQKIAFSIYSIFNESNIFNENGWIVSFNAGLSDYNKARLAWVEREAKAAVENAQF